MKKSIIIILAIWGVVGAQAQDLSEPQKSRLQEIEQGFVQQATMFEGLVQNKLVELATELQREGRLDTEEVAAEAAATVNAIMKDLSGLYGDFIKTKVEYVLKAKNTLTDEQKIQLLSELAPNEALPYETIVYLQPETFDLSLNLSPDQEKKMVKLEAAMVAKELEIERDIELLMLDLKPVLLSGKPQPDVVDPIVMKLADLAGQAIDNRVEYFLKAKDTLTLEQKRELAKIMGL